MGDQETTGQQPEEAPADDEQADTAAQEDSTPSSPPSDPPTDGDGGDGGDVIFHGQIRTLNAARYAPPARLPDGGALVIPGACAGRHAAPGKAG
jgi:hypothetical protein